MALKPRTRLGNKMKPTGIKTVQPAQNGLTTQGPKEIILTRDDCNSKTDRIHAAISTNHFADFVFHMSLILQGLKLKHKESIGNLYNTNGAVYTTTNPTEGAFSQDLLRLKIDETVPSEGGE